MRFRKLTMGELGRVDAETFSQLPKRRWILLLDNVRSLHNVGAMFRTADAFALEGMALCGFTGTPPHRELHAAALGAEETVPWRHFSDSLEALREFRGRGYSIVALEQCVGSLRLGQHGVVGVEPMVLIVGNEVEGVQDSLLAECDFCVEIPQFGTKHSLNVTTAVGIALWAFGAGEFF